MSAIDLSSKDVWVAPLKVKKGVTIVSAFQKILDNSERKPNKIWIVEGSEFYKNSFKKWLIENRIEIYSTHNEGKPVVAERFIKKVKNKTYRHMTAVSKNIYFDVLDDIVDNYNKTFCRTIKMKPIDVKSDSYTEYNVDSNENYPKFKIGNVRISKYKNIFAKGYASNWSEEVFIIRRIKNTVSWTYVINDLKGEEIVGTFSEKVLQNTNQNLVWKNKIKRNRNELYVKWKGYDSSFNNWIDKKEIV